MNNSPQLLVYKASAGSGKTFTLAVEYIKLLIQHPTAYRNILAVTFTNKATTEMKERILGQLYGIWTNDPASKPYLNKIKEELENPDITLDKSLELYKESVEYTKICLDTLKDADGKILVIKNEIDKLIEKPLDISGV